MDAGDALKCFYHDVVDEKLDPTVGYWIEAEDGDRVVGYLCSQAANAMRKVNAWHRFRDAMQAQHPDAFFYLVKAESDGEKRILLAIADDV